MNSPCRGHARALIVDHREGRNVVPDDLFEFEGLGVAADGLAIRLRSRGWQRGDRLQRLARVSYSMPDSDGISTQRV